MTDDYKKARDAEFNEFWSTEPFGFDHPGTEDGIKSLMDWTFNYAMNSDVVREIVEALNQISKLICNPCSMTDAKHQLGSCEKLADKALAKFNEAKRGGE